ncbi:lantibiotic dehydratase [Streptomyces flavofungini]|uniref:lantibiotic dehydratase n=1 Tax=Streptomyces flavofungini TaxID=68200 RepID=UPI0025AFA3BA|nr:lantibiotic dehydratase [Streptomyces flavofungini]WJV48890.1 lantibiotic dehydratase [Streptomyces flavofungini]
MKRSRLLQRGDALLLRATVLPAEMQHTCWPSGEDTAECRQWLTEVWSQAAFAEAVRAASPQLAFAVEAAITSEATLPRKVHKATNAVARYLLRATGRPTPFGLFAGVTTASCGPAQARIGSAHRVLARPDTLWLDRVRRDLQGRHDVVPHLRVQVSDLVVRLGDDLERPLPGGRRAKVRLTRPLQAVLDAAVNPARCAEIAEQLTPRGATAELIQQLITSALDVGLLTSSLAAPVTDTDPLGHLVGALLPVAADLDVETVEVLRELDAIHQLLTDHNTTPKPTTAAMLRRTAEDRMSGINDQGRVRLSVDLCLDAAVQIPEHVLDEAELAADALLRLTRNQGERPVWSAYHTLFWERYGAGSLVPVRDAVDLAAGAGLPADFPMSLWPQPPARSLPRDELLMAKAWQAAVAGSREVQLTEDDLDDLCGPSSEDTAIAPHMEMGIRVHAPSSQALDRGEFTLAVRPAWSTGTLTGRFASLLNDSALAATYEKLPTLVDGALLAQLSFAPTYPHAENVARTPALVPHVISVGEHCASQAHIIPVDDLAVLSTSRRLHLVSLSRRRIVEPVVLHPLALEKQAPPLARFIALIGRGFATAWTHFDWGPAASGLPYLPRVRYRKTVLSPARWRLSARALPAGPYRVEWRAGLEEWTRTWKCPSMVDLRDDDRTLRLDLREALHARLLHRHLQRHPHAELLETPADDALGWIGHAHEFTVPLTSIRPPQPHPDLGSAPVVTNQMLPNPGDTEQPWVQAKLFTHPNAMDQILTRRLPSLLHELGAPRCWFVRYRTPQEEDHLRLRIAVQGPARHAETTQALARWAAHLQTDALAARLLFDGYRPESGRYGTDQALAAAEDVFVADSTAVRQTLTDLGLDRHVLCALGMLDIARGLLGQDAGTQWMATTPARGSADPTVTRQTLQLVRDGGLPKCLGLTVQLDDLWAQRRNLLAAYRTHLTNDRAVAVLESLLHMHHNRLMGPGREAEAACRHAARQAARSLTTRRGRT